MDRAKSLTVSRRSLSRPFVQPCRHPLHICFLSTRFSPFASGGPLHSRIYSIHRVEVRALIHQRSLPSLCLLFSFHFGSAPLRRLTPIAILPVAQPSVACLHHSFASLVLAWAKPPLPPFFLQANRDSNTARPETNQRWRCQLQGCTTRPRPPIPPITTTLILVTTSNHHLNTIHSNTSPTYNSVVSRYIQTQPPCQAVPAQVHLPPLAPTPRFPVAVEA